jgi:hypothetical protein
MTVETLAKKLGFETLCMPDGDREVNGVYACDLLSWVMGRASQDNVWITIMSNLNIVAVATLADPACIILSENLLPDPDTLARAEQQGINILSTELDTFDACVRIAELI